MGRSSATNTRRAPLPEALLTRKGSPLKALSICALSVLLVTPEPSAATEITARVKAVGNWLNADERDSVARFGLDPAYGMNLDGRLTLANFFGRDESWGWEIAGEVTTLQGDVIENAALFRGQSSGEATALINDQRRAINLTTSLSSGSRHQTIARLDRASLVWQRGEWRARLGRQALSLGGGLVFNPMDIFSPFAPTATDRDFKNGDDALVITRSGSTGSELEAIAVVRREPGDAGPGWDQGSYGLRFRHTWRELEYELVGARHFDTEVAMLSLSGPLGGAAWRLNWVGAREGGDVTHSLVANLDYAFGFREQAGYAFVEYYHNGWGSNAAAEDITNVAPSSLARLNRGELFVIERNYAAIGTSLGLSPLVNFTVTAIVNLDDWAPLTQTAFSYTAGNNTTVEAGIIAPTGGRADEFGGVVLTRDEPAGTGLLTGTSRQFYLRFVRFF